jgi:P4 family phage/plasmid primase-like protien
MPRALRLHDTDPQNETELMVHAPPIEPVGPAEADEPDAMRYSRYAKWFLDSTEHDGQQTLWFWKEKFWQWTTSDECYKPLTFRELTNVVLKWLCDQEISSLFNTADQVAHVLESCVAVKDLPAMPAWFSQAKNRHTNHILLSNYLVDIQSLVKGRTECYQKPTPSWFSSIRLPYPYQPKSACQSWLTYLTSMLDQDGQRIALLQEYIGYLLTPDTSRQVALFLYGHEGTGKSTVAKVVEHLIGKENCSYESLSNFGKDHAMTTMVHASLNICHEVSKMTAVGEECFKKFVSGEDSVINEKYVPGYSSTPTARILACVNTWPKFHDNTGSVYRRIKVIPFEHRIPIELQDNRLLEKFLNELPGIFNWSIEGLRRLNENGWTNCEAGERILNHYRLQAQPYLEFVQTCIRKKNGGFIAGPALHAAYREWCDRHEMPCKGDITTLYSAVRRDFPTSQKLRKRINGKQEYGLTDVVIEV